MYDLKFGHVTTNAFPALISAKQLPAQKLEMKLNNRLCYSAFIHRGDMCRPSSKPAAGPKVALYSASLSILYLCHNRYFNVANHNFGEGGF